MKWIKVNIQYWLPQHALSWLMGKLADTRIIWFKNLMIYLFMKRYPIDMSIALLEDAYAYPCFNEFFIRQLKPELRPIAADTHDMVSPVDGRLSQMGHIVQQQLLQAKGSYFDLENLLGGDKVLSRYFADGLFSTFYLAPHNYHRVHMPIDGRLLKTIFVPGRLFSVNAAAAELIPQLYARNERLICLFETAVGQMAVILVGALIVGSIKTVWQAHPYRSTHIEVADANTFAQGQGQGQGQPLEIQKGAQLGYFKMGSTVIILMPKNSVNWLESLKCEDEVIMGEKIGTIAVAVTKFKGRVD